MSDLIEFRIPGSFITARTIPTKGELAYGFRRGWVSPADVVAVALAKYKRDLPLSKAEEELALLLPEDLDRVPSLVGNLQTEQESNEDPARVWQFLTLAWLFEHRASYPNALQIIEMLAADFEFPEELHGLLRFMPPGAGESTGKEALYERWRKYLDRMSDYYKRRDLYRTNSNT